MKNTEYICPRCGYATFHKMNMRHHLYKRQKPCPGTVSKVILTDDIREDILANRIYVSEPSSSEVTKTQTFNQVVYNYNIMNNFVNNMDVMDKLDKFVNHKKIDLIGFDEHIMNKYNQQIDKLEKGDFKRFYLDTAGIVDIIHDVTRCDDLSTCNVIHDPIKDDIMLFTNGQWETNRFERGIESILRNIQDCYLDSYEKYLLCKAYNGGPFVQTEVKEYLEHYYKILACFDLPSILEHHASDGDILGTDSDDMSLRETYYEGLYRHVENTTSISQANKIKRNVCDVVKRNSKCNVIELNRQMMELIKVDEEFQKGVLAKLMSVS